MKFQDFEFATNIDWKAVEALQEKEQPEIKKKTELAFAVIDAETDPFNGQDFVSPFIWGFFDGENYEEFSGPYCTENLVERISQYKGNIFAHNGGKFDFHFLVEHFEKEKSLTVINGRIAKAKLGLATLRDSFCVLPTPLSAFAKDDFDYKILDKKERDKPENVKKISDYLKSDCINLHGYVSRFVGDYGLNLTLAATALKQWQELGGRIPKSDKRYYNKFLPFYYGGRVEPFKSGIFEGEYKVYDIKSAYPTAMKFPHPIGTNYYESRKPRDRELPACMLTVRCNSRGAFPMRTKEGLRFPHEKGIYRVTGWEFIKALETGTISEHSILNAYIFEETTDFSIYVDKFYQLKAEAEKNKDKGGRTIAKLFLNSLYGKFAANPENYEEYYLDDYGAIPKEDENGEFDPGPIYGDLQLFGRDLPESKWRFYNIVTAASITGWVRAYLWESIQKCESVLYCDTDSIICKSGDQLPLGDELGNWDLEAEPDRIAIAGKKLYACFKDGKEIKKACKGVKISGKEIERVARGEIVKYVSEAECFSLKQGKHFIERNVRATAKPEIIS